MAHSLEGYQTSQPDHVTLPAYDFLRTLQAHANSGKLQHLRLEWVEAFRDILFRLHKRINAATNPYHQQFVDEFNTVHAALMQELHRDILDQRDVTIKKFSRDFLSPSLDLPMPVRRIDALLRSAYDDIYISFHDNKCFYGPQDGGCFPFAASLKATLSAMEYPWLVSLVMITRDNNSDHIMVKVSIGDKAYYVDSEGIFDASSAIARIQGQVRDTNVSIVSFDHVAANKNGLVGEPNQKMIPVLATILSDHAEKVA